MHQRKTGQESHSKASAPYDNYIFTKLLLCPCPGDSCPASMIDHVILAQLQLYNPHLSSESFDDHERDEQEPINKGFQETKLSMQLRHWKTSDPVVRPLPLLLPHLDRLRDMIPDYVAPAAAVGGGCGVVVDYTAG